MVSYLYMKHTRKGFTIIELLVVVAIIGMLGAVVLSALSTSRAKSYDTQRVSDVKQLQNALQLYYNDYKRYPTTLNPDLLVPLYIKAIPADPRTGADYQYAALGSGTRCSDYHLGATLETVASGAGVLSNDFDSTGSGATCTGSAADFSGTDPVYDVRP